MIRYFYHSIVDVTTLDLSPLIAHPEWTLVNFFSFKENIF